MVQPGGETDFREESLAPQDSRQLGAQYLKCDVAPVPYIVGEVDRGHATLTQLAHELVPIQQGRRQIWCDRAHGLVVEVMKVDPIRVSA